ncbi:hypothetical protein [Rubinisphaera margarita]|uniref:hypothetical protein n=1 Tax=Rubinisphaera margarita TaxID=2909586 RepID=UPI001EE91EE9|nr:hypothetical protein [Rubinisphaera margarita]MCG6156419.1 hypothetical protein [Rubinisphaera margarita]
MNSYQHDAPSSESHPASSRLAVLSVTTLGVFALTSALLIMPTLALSTAGFYLGLASLVAFMATSIFAGRILSERAELARQKCPVRNPAQELANRYQDRHHG